MLTLVLKRGWRHPERLILQIVMPYVFVADEAVYMTQMPPVTRFQPQPWPNVLINGRFASHT